MATLMLYMALKALERARFTHFFLLAATNCLTAVCY